MDIKNLIALSMVKGIGPSFIKRNLSRIISDNSCVPLIRENKPDQETLVSQFLIDAENIITECELEGIEIITIISPSYPNNLKEISDPPSVLYLKGNKKLMHKSLAIIGTRKSTILGNTIASKLGKYFSQEFAICNGLVEGIDSSSIYVDGKVIPNTIGIISGGLCYKKTCTKEHVKIIDEVLASGGLIISEYPPYTKEDQYSGSKASRIQAGLSNGLILVQSSRDGGSKYTIATYAKLGRALGVIHYPSSEEYYTEVFSGNRLIVEKKYDGIAEMIGLKTKSKVNINSITVIESKEDYLVFKEKIESNISLNFKF